MFDPFDAGLHIPMLYMSMSEYMEKMHVSGLLQLQCLTVGYATGCLGRFRVEPSRAESYPIQIRLQESGLDCVVAWGCGIMYDAIANKLSTGKSRRGRCGGHDAPYDHRGAYQ